MSNYRIAKYTTTCVRESSVAIPTHRMTCRNDVAGFVRSYAETFALEHVIIVALDASNKIIGFEVTQGATNQCALYPANAFRFLINAGASSFIVAHNHPGGSMEPSRADWEITRKLYTAGKALDIPLVDHVLVTEEGALSFSQDTSSQWAVHCK